jgi:hypothetical protein
MRRNGNVWRISSLYGTSSMVILLLYSCTTWKNTSFEPLNRQLQRQESISKNIVAQFYGKEEYVSIDFGDEYLIKPESFKPLDSLYGLQYEESHFGGLSRSREVVLGRQIDSVLAKVIKDTVLFKYEINHIFGLSSEDSIQIVSAKFLLNHRDSVENVSIDFQFTDKEKFYPYFIEFLKRKSFLYAQDTPSDKENDFYTFFETALDNQIGAVRKGNFIDHILHVMHAANLQKSLSTELIIKQLILDNITRYVSAYKSIAWSSIKTALGDSSQLVSYFVQHEWEYTGKEGKTYHLKREFQLDPYFQIIGVAEVDKIDY